MGSKQRVEEERCGSSSALGIATHYNWDPEVGLQQTTLFIPLIFVYKFYNLNKIWTLSVHKSWKNIEVDIKLKLCFPKYFQNIFYSNRTLINNNIIINVIGYVGLSWGKKKG